MPHVVVNIDLCIIKWIQSDLITRFYKTIIEIRSCSDVRSLIHACVHSLLDLELLHLFNSPILCVQRKLARIDLAIEALEQANRLSTWPSLREKWRFITFLGL